LRILVLAYACEPGKGSEPGTGWMWSRMLSRFGDVVVITRSNNRSSIESAAPEHGHPIHFEYADLPEWARFWKRGKGGIRLYYVLWQIAAYRKARRLMRNQSFDLLWHVSIANAWLGSAFGLFKRPFVFGPVSGGVPSCWRLSIVGRRGLIEEVGRSLVRTLARPLNPLARLAWARSALILTNNEDTSRWLPRRHRAKTEVFPNVVLETTDQVGRKVNPERHKAIYAGELLHWKGIALAIAALDHLPGWTLDIYGKGPDEPRLRSLVRDRGMTERVRFMGWVERQDLFHVMETEADVLLFPSLHDELGWVVAEALTHGLPVVSLDRGGPGSLGATTVPFNGLERTAADLAMAVRTAGPVSVMKWDLGSRTDSLKSILERRGLVTASASPTDR
jgi:glycosyltransferase involved in cell wall biosynthesis